MDDEENEVSQSRQRPDNVQLGPAMVFDYNNFSDHIIRF